MWGIRTSKHNNKVSLYFNKCSMNYKSDQNVTKQKLQYTKESKKQKNDQKNESTNHTIQSLASQYTTSEYYESWQYNIQ